MSKKRVKFLRRMRAIPLALVLTLVLVAPLALATCQHCNDGVFTTACALAEYPIEAKGMVTMRADITWRMCIVFYFDSDIIPIGCTVPRTRSGTEVVPLIPPEPPSYRIGVTVEGQYLSGGGGGRTPPPELLSSGWVTDSSATAIEDCYGYCEI